MAMSASEACKRLFPLIEQVNDLRNPWRPSQGRHRLPRLRRRVAHPKDSPSPAVPPANTEHLPRSIAAAEAGRTTVQELIDPQHDVT
ncbi:MAG: hypothetical protein ACRDSF_24160 [Pseudonocardiaceae bacterium]